MEQLISKKITIFAKNIEHGFNGFFKETNQ